MYIEKNVNPKGKKTADCVVRAFSIALNKSWDDVYMDLATIGLKLKCMPNENKTWIQYAENNGMIKGIKQTGKKQTVKEFAENHSTGIYVLRVANHLTVVINGNYIDSWDCGYKSVYMYYMVVK